MNHHRKKFSILISSCDKYSDLWLPIGNLYKKYWRKCPYKIFLLTENLNFKKITKLNTNIKTINVNSRSWSKRLKFALKSNKIKSRDVLLVLDDFFIQSKVSNNLINYYYYQFIKYRMQMLRIVARPSPKKKNKIINNIGKIDRLDKYVISTQAAFWNKNVLINQLKNNENIWEFEINGSKRIQNKKINFFGVYKDILPYKHHVIERGKWFPWYFQKFKKMKIGISEKRPKLNFIETLIWLFKKFILIYLIKLIIFFRNIFK